MRALIVEGRLKLGQTWRTNICQSGIEVDLEADLDAAFATLRHNTYDVIVLDLTFGAGAVIGLADYVGFRSPNTQVMFVSDNQRFADGSIFQFSSNACALLCSSTPPADLASMVEYFCTRSEHQERAANSATSTVDRSLNFAPQPRLWHAA